MPLCHRCQFLGFCYNRLSPAIRPEQVEDPRVRQAVHTYTYEFGHKRGLSIFDLQDELSNLMRDYEGRFFEPARFTDSKGYLRTVSPDFDTLFDRSESWFKAFGRPHVTFDDVELRASKVAWAALATILIARFPHDCASILGAHANDNRAPSAES